MGDSQNSIFTFDGYRVDPESRSLSAVSGETIPLTPKVFDTLLYLVTNPGRVVGKDELMREVWADTIVEENNLSQNISILRRTFGEKPGERRFIETVAGKGFRFLPEVTVENGYADEDFDLDSDGSRETAAFDEDHRSAPRSSRWMLPVSAAVLLVTLTGFFLWRQNSSVTSGSVRSMAVLPFKPLVPENGNPALEIGMADTLIWKLSGGDIDVRPLSSVRRYGSPEQDPVAAGRELGVDTVLDGRLNTINDRIRITAQLIRVSDGKQLWAGQFDDSFNDIFAVQDSISAKVASELKVRLGGNDRKVYTANAEAYQLYLKGRYLSQKVQLSEIINGINYFEQALSLDPNYVPAYVGLADAYRATVLTADVPPTDALIKAKTAANKAASLDNSYAEAHAVLGWLTFWYDWDWNAAEQEARRALELDPESSDAHQFYAHLLSNTSRHEQALSEAKRAIEIEPLSLRANSFYGMFLYQAGKYDEALAQLGKTLDLDPNYRLALMFTSRALSEQGNFEGAITTARKVQETSKDATDPITYEAYALVGAGRQSEARAILDRFLIESKRRYISPYNIALIFSALGETDEALNYLEKAYAEKDIRMVFLGVEPKWKGLRDDPRFVRLLEKMNLSVHKINP
jgi:DNA-binding winged helix-turn-helix (wHTH) protein/TolB-like protein/Tfp pilus assembly protein PilF